jgi:Bacterial regulatory proteins, luxR family
VAVHRFASIAKEFRELPRLGRPVAELVREAMRVILGAVPADGWAVLTLDPATLLATSGVHEHGFSTDALRRLYELEYGEDDVTKFSSLARALTPVGLLSQATQRELTKSARYRDVLAPAGYEHELRAALRSNKHTWGALFLLRRSSKPDFIVEEESLVREVADAFGDALRATLRSAGALTDTRTGRGLLVVGQNQEIVVASPAASVWLAELAGEGTKDTGWLPHTVRSTVNGARRGAERGGQTSAHVRVRGASGQWLTVHAAVLGDGNAVVSIDEGRPIAVAAPILAAHALSSDEGEVLRDLLHGSEDSHIAERIGTSLEAVRASIDEVLRKVGVESRTGLAKKLFFEHYFERVQAGAPVGPDGYFSRG